MISWFSYDQLVFLWHVVLFCVPWVCPRPPIVATPLLFFSQPPGFFPIPHVFLTVLVFFYMVLVFFSGSLVFPCLHSSSMSPMIFPCPLFFPMAPYFFTHTSSVFFQQPLGFSCDPSGFSHGPFVFAWAFRFCHGPSFLWPLCFCHGSLDFPLISSHSFSGFPMAHSSLFFHIAPWVSYRPLYFFLWPLVFS